MVKEIDIFYNCSKCFVFMAMIPLMLTAIALDGGISFSNRLLWKVKRSAGPPKTSETYTLNLFKIPTKNPIWCCVKCDAQFILDYNHPKHIKAHWPKMRRKLTETIREHPKSKQQSRTNKTLLTHIKQLYTQYRIRYTIQNTL